MSAQSSQSPQPSQPSQPYVWLEGTYPVAISDSAFCRDCDWHTGYQSIDGRWYSKTLARAKSHVRSTGHKVEYRQTRFGLIQLPDPRKEEQS